MEGKIMRYQVKSEVFPKISQFLEIKPYNAMLTK